MNLGSLIVIINISWYLANKLREKSQLEYISPKNRAVLVTGCDSGFGHHVCYQLDSYGFYVFAGVLDTNSESAEKLRNKCSNRLRVIKLDVTQVEDIKSVVKEIEASGVELWAVLNNAGIAQYSLVEMGHEIDVFEKIFAVNVFGLVRVTKYCLPLLRKSGGRVVNMSSVAGRFTFWGITAYCMSKYAVRAFSDGLRKEIQSFGVKVVTIEPNMYRTEITNIDILTKSIDHIWQTTDPQICQDYGGQGFYEKIKNRLKYNVMISRPQIHEVIDTQTKAITVCEPNLYYQCAAITEKPCLWFLGLLPESVQDLLLTGKMWKFALDFYKCKQ
ncbi:retinol dehydrogenase 7-like [Oppia nitens]|uniref:retinol dehydrogenase 7-like n=1 Tax=Oppia nitens TaxID=1686743 RepID=UPI0023D9B828|nr:retinol dehydrogenase 7-like [Oppia nitens]